MKHMNKNMTKLTRRGVAFLLAMILMVSAFAPGAASAAEGASHGARSSAGGYCPDCKVKLTADAVHSVACPTNCQCAAAPADGAPHEAGCPLNLAEASAVISEETDGTTAVDTTAAATTVETTAETEGTTVSTETTAAPTETTVATEATTVPTETTAATEETNVALCMVCGLEECICDLENAVLMNGARLYKNYTDAAEEPKIIDKDGISVRIKEVITAEDGTVWYAFAYVNPLQQLLNGYSYVRQEDTVPVESEGMIQNEAYLAAMDTLTALEEEAKHLAEGLDAEAEDYVEQLTGQCNIFYAKLRAAYEVIFEQWSNGEIIQEDYDAATAKYESILLYLKNTYGYENGEINLTAERIGKEVVTTKKPGIKINLFDYGRWINTVSSAYGFSNGTYKLVDGHMYPSYMDGFAEQQDNTGFDTSAVTKRNLNEDGYPVIHNSFGGTTKDTSLKDLFNAGLEAATAAPNDLATDFDLTKMPQYGVKRYPVEQGSLFVENGDYLVYNSRNNHAYYEFENKRMVVMDYAVKPGFGVDDRYTATGHFLPFNGPIENYVEGVDYTKVDVNSVPVNFLAGQEYLVNQGTIDHLPKEGLHRTSSDLYSLNTEYNTDHTKRVNMWFGLTTEFAFNQPKRGQVNEKDMIFEFSGDDFMWVYVDNVLLLDIFFNEYKEAINGARCARINFATGDIFVFNTDYTYEDVIDENGDLLAPTDRAQYLAVDTTIKECFEKAKIENPDLEMPEFSGNTFADYSNHKFKLFYQEFGACTSNCLIKFNMPPLPENSVTVEKDVPNDTVNESFAFEIDVEGRTSVDFVDNDGTSGSMEVPGTFYLRNNESRTFKLNYTDKYTIKEVAFGKNGYESEVVGVEDEGNDGVITGEIGEGEIVYMTYVNTPVPADVVTNKTVSEDSLLGDYTLTLDAFATGTTTTVTNVKPADIVLIMDQSCSMLEITGDAMIATQMDPNKAKHLGYYIVNGKNGSNTTGNWYLVQYVEGDPLPWKYYYAKNTNGVSNIQKVDDTAQCVPGALPFQGIDGYSSLTLGYEYATAQAIMDANNGLQDHIYVSRYGTVYDAAIQFVNNIAATGIDHRIAIAGFSHYNSGAPAFFKQNTGNFLYNGSVHKQLEAATDVNGQITTSDYQNAFKFVNTESGLSDIIASLNAYKPNYWSTYMAYGFQIANNVFENNSINAEERSRIAIVFSDGEINGSTDDVVNTVNITKNTYGAKVYAVGTAGASKSFMNQIASSEDCAIYASDAEALERAFGTISSEISGTGVVLNEKAILRDTISHHFKLRQEVLNEYNEAASDEAKLAVLRKYIKISTAPYTGMVNGEYTFGAETDVTDSMNIVIRKTESENGTLDVVDVSGFNYMENYVATVNGQNIGKKIIVRIPIEMSDSNVGGEKQETNLDDKTGIYNGETKVEDFPLPFADTPALVNVKKVVTGNMGDWSKVFNFSASGLRYKKNAENYYDSTYDEVSGHSNYLENYAEQFTGDTAETFTMSHGGYLVNEHDVLIDSWYEMIVPGSGLTVTELNVPTEYTTKIIVTDKDGAKLQEVDRGTMITVSEVKPGMTITFYNDYAESIETGVVLDSLPYILILGGVAAVAVFLIFRRRRAYED